MHVHMHTCAHRILILGCRTAHVVARHRTLERAIGDVRDDAPLIALVTLRPANLRLGRHSLRLAIRLEEVELAVVLRVFILDTRAATAGGLDAPAPRPIIWRGRG